MRHLLGRVTALMVGATLAVTGCSGAEPQAVRAGEVYDAVVRLLATEVDTEPVEPDEPGELLVIHVERWDDGAVDLAVQAEVVASTAEVATVRFIDTRDEAIEWIDDVAQVRHGGLLVRLGPVPDRGRQVEVLVDRWNEADRFERRSMTVVQRGDTWAVVGEPSLVGVVEIP